MNIECIGCINWVKFSEIIFEGLIVGLTVIAAYFLGRLQSDRNWRREVTQREKEQKEKEENEMNSRRIDGLTNVSKHVSTFLSNISFYEKSVRIESDAYFVQQSTNTEIENVLPLFQEEILPDTFQILSSLKTQIYDFPRIPPQSPIDGIKREFHEIRRENLIYGNVFHEFRERFDLILALQEQLSEKIEELVKEFGQHQ